MGKLTQSLNALLAESAEKRNELVAAKQKAIREADALIARLTQDT